MSCNVCWGKHPTWSCTAPGIDRHEGEMRGFRTGLVDAVVVSVEALNRANRQLSLAREALKNDIASRLGLDPDHVVVGTFWECVSPAGRCVWDVSEDPYRDHCLFCRQPAERK